MKLEQPEVIERLKQLCSTKGIPDEMKQSVSFLRQWLNEDRKCEPLVTTKEIWSWLEKDYNKAIKNANSITRG